MAFYGELASRKPRKAAAEETKTPKEPQEKKPGARSSQEPAAKNFPPTFFDHLEEELGSIRERGSQSSADLRHNVELIEQQFATHKTRVDPEKDNTVQIQRIEDHLQTVRKLADIYDDLDRFCVATKEGAPQKDPKEALKEAKIRLEREAAFKEELDNAKKRLAPLENGRTDEKDTDAQNTKGLKQKDLTLSAPERLKHLEEKIHTRFKEITGRALNDENGEFERLLHGGSISPLSPLQRAGQWMRQITQKTVGHVFERLNDLSLKDDVADYKSLEEEYIKAKEGVETLEKEDHAKLLYRKELIRRAKKFDPTKLEEDAAQLQRLANMETPSLRAVKAGGRAAHEEDEALRKERQKQTRWERAHEDLEEDTLSEQNREEPYTMIVPQIKNEPYTIGNQPQMVTQADRDALGQADNLDTESASPFKPETVMYDQIEDTQKNLRELLDMASGNAEKPKEPLIEEIAIPLTKRKEKPFLRVPSHEEASLSIQPDRVVIPENKAEEERARIVIRSLADTFNASLNWNTKKSFWSTDAVMEIYRNLQDHPFTEQEIKRGMELFFALKTPGWETARDGRDPHKTEDMKNKLTIAAGLAEFIGVPLSIKPEKQRGESTKAVSGEKSEAAEEIPMADLEMVLGDSLEKASLPMETIKRSIEDRIKQVQGGPPKAWESLQDTLRASLLFKGEGARAHLTPENIAKKYLEFLAIFRAAKTQEKPDKNLLKWIQKNVINNLSPPLGVPTEKIDQWALQDPSSLELVPESIAAKLDTFKQKKPAAQPIRKTA